MTCSYMYYSEEFQEEGKVRMGIYLETISTTASLNLEEKIF